MSLCTVTVHGNLVRDPSVKEIGDGVVCNGTIAYSSGWGDNEVTGYLDFECWGKRGEALGNNAEKGTSIVMSGELKPADWTDRDGNKRKAFKVRVTDYSYAGSPRRSEETVEAGDGRPPF